MPAEAPLCVSGVRERRCLSQRGFELANGLPFVATDEAIHCLLDERTVAESQALQVALGQVRSTLGLFRTTAWNRPIIRKAEPSVVAVGK